MDNSGQLVFPPISGRLAPSMLTFYEDIYISELRDSLSKARFAESGGSNRGMPAPNPTSEKDFAYEIRSPRSALLNPFFAEGFY